MYYYKLYVAIVNVTVEEFHKRLDSFFNQNEQHADL